MISLYWDTQHLDLEALMPPHQLERQFDNARRLAQLIKIKAIARSRQGLRFWVDAGLTQRECLERQAKADYFMTFMNGKRIEQIDDAYAEQYLLFLAHDPAARAACLIAREILQTEPDAHWEGVSSRLAPLLPR